MKISRNGKVILGILTMAQLFFIFFGIIWFFTAVFPVLITGNDQAIQEILRLSLARVVILIALTSLLSLGLQIFYIIHAGTNKSISTAMKVIWICLLFFIGFIVEVVYFFMEILPENSMTGRLEAHQEGERYTV